MCRNIIKLQDMVLKACEKIHKETGHWWSVRKTMSFLLEIGAINQQEYQALLAEIE